MDTQFMDLDKHAVMFDNKQWVLKHKQAGECFKPGTRPPQSKTFHNTPNLLIQLGECEETVSEQQITSLREKWQEIKKNANYN